MTADEEALGEVEASESPIGEVFDPWPIGQHFSNDPRAEEKDYGRLPMRPVAVRLGSSSSLGGHYRGRGE